MKSKVKIRSQRLKVGNKAKKPETIADIVAGILAKNPREDYPAEYGGGEVPNKMRELAYRIERAWKREKRKIKADWKREKCEIEGDALNAGGMVAMTILKKRAKQ